MRITIDVMNMFPRSQFSTQMLLHKMPMDTHLFSIYSDGFVSMLWPIRRLKTKVRKLFQMFFCQARARAIFCFFNPVRWNIVRNPATLANFVYAGGVSIIRHTLLQYMLLLHSVTLKAQK